MIIRVVLLLLLVWLSACSAERPRLHPHLDPTGFVRPSQAQEIRDQGAHFWILPIPLERANLIRLQKLWSGGLAQRLDASLPFSQISDSDLTSLDPLVGGWLKIFYLWAEKPISQKVLSDTLCPGLSEKELLFLSQSSVEEIRTLGLHMLLISFAELALQQGLEPHYPSIYSDHLRLRQGLGARLPLSGLLISGTMASTQKQGFWVCRR